MLVVRKAQMDEMIMGDEDEFVSFLVSHAKEEHPEVKEDYTDDELRIMVRGGIKKAKSYGFKHHDDITGFVAVMFEIAPNFDEQEQIKEVLEEEGLNANQKFDKLWSDIVPDEAWEEADENYDDKAWFEWQKKEATSEDDG